MLQITDGATLSVAEKKPAGGGGKKKKKKRRRGRRRKDHKSNPARTTTSVVVEEKDLQHTDLRYEVNLPMSRKKYVKKVKEQMLPFLPYIRYSSPLKVFLPLITIVS